MNKSILFFFLFTATFLHAKAQNQLLTGGSSKTWNVDLMVINQQDTVQEMAGNCIYETNVTFKSDNSFIYSSPCTEGTRILPQAFEADDSVIITETNTFYIQSISESALELMYYATITESGSGLSDTAEHVVPVKIYYHAE